MQIESIPRTSNGPVQQPTQRSSPVSGVSSRENTAQTANKPDVAQSKAIVAGIRQNLKVLNNVELSFSVHEASGDVVVTVTDEDTGKVIREVPEREMLNLAAHLEEMVGMIFDQKA